MSRFSDVGWWKSFGHHAPGLKHDAPLTNNSFALDDSMHSHILRSDKINSLNVRKSVTHTLSSSPAIHDASPNKGDGAEEGVELDSLPLSSSNSFSPLSFSLSLYTLYCYLKQASDSISFIQYYAIYPHSPLKKQHIRSDCPLNQKTHVRFILY